MRPSYHPRLVSATVIALTTLLSSGGTTLAASHTAAPGHPNIPSVVSQSRAHRHVVGVHALAHTLFPVNLHNYPRARGGSRHERGEVRPLSAGATLVVTSTLDASSCPNGSGQPGYTLRCAITQANADGSGDTIDFAIAASDSGCTTSTPRVCTISPNTPNATGAGNGPLPTLTASNTIINGYSEAPASRNTLPLTGSGSGDNAVITVQIDGKAGGAGLDGLDITGSGDTVEGLSITNFTYNAGNGLGGNAIGLERSGATADRVVGDFLGIAPDGTTTGANAYDLIVTGAAGGEQIGSASSGDRNLIDDASVAGIVLSNSRQNLIQGNYIGTDHTGSLARGNRDGIEMFFESGGDTIGGPAAGAGNVISGNSRWGIDAPYIVGFAGPDIGATIQGNYIGINAAGTAVLGNGSDGIELSDTQSFTIGGTATGAGNVISGNGGSGISASGRGTLIQGNLIGTSPGGLSLPNQGYGVYLSTGSYLDRVSGNTIANNANAGVGIGGSATDTVHSVISQNSMSGNGSAGILLFGQPLTNCTFGPSPGAPNDYTPCPVIKATTTTQVSGDACSGCTVELFTAASRTDDEGKTYIGSATASTCSVIPCAGTWTVNGSFSLGQTFTATATVPSFGVHPSETSDFSAPAVLGQTLVVTSTLDTASCPNGSGGSGYTLRCAIAQANTDGAGDAIHFAIPTSDTGCKTGTSGGRSLSICTIAPATALPQLTATFATIDGYSQTGAQSSATSSAAGDSASIAVVISGSSTSGADGLTIAGTYDSVRGLSVINFQPDFNGNGGNAIHISGTSANYDVIDGVMAGVAPDGTTAGANGTGVLVDGGAGGARIGGLSQTATNVFSGNTNYGVELADTSSAGGSTIANSLIGANAAGTAALANGLTGVLVYGSSGSSIGWPCCTAGNVISGNGGDGVDVDFSTGTTIATNTIGTTAAGTAPLANGVTGILLYGGGPNTVGPANLIGGNTSDGIDVLADGGDTITGNRIGLGSLPLGNGINGISVSNETGTAAAQRLLARVRAPRRPATVAVSVSVLFGTISNNEIADNGGYTATGLPRAGILVGQNAQDVNVHVDITQNTIFDNGNTALPEPGIELTGGAFCSGSGSGPNDYAVCPQIDALNTSPTQVVGTGACPGCTIEAFIATNEPDDVASSGGPRFGEGQIYLGSATANANGQWTVFVPAGDLLQGQFVTATQTQQVPNTGGTNQPPAAYETSDFGVNVQVPGTQSSVSVPIGQGWSLVSVPVNGIASASALTTSIERNLGSGTVKAIAVVVNGAFVTYIPGHSTDIVLNPTQGVFVLSTVAGNWVPSISPSSSLYGGDQPVVLNPGWNLVAAAYPEGSLTPAEIAAEAGAAGCSVAAIATYSNGSYSTWIAATEAGGPSTIPFTSGMWILCQEARPTAWFPH